MTLTTGSRLGPFQILGELGSGGMGSVFRARDTTLNRQVAIKVLPESFASDAERVARFAREARTLAALNHPHIAQIYGLEESSGTRALVMELVEGEDLSARIARGPVPIADTLMIARQIAEALSAAHEQGIIHRDLKPANVRVTPDDVVKVLDFGLAKLAGADADAAAGAPASPTITSPAMMTGLGAILGTAAYMAPEQARGRPADKRSDVWAFGSVVYEMLTGSRPFAGEDVAETIANILKTEPDWSVLPSDTPPALRALLEGCLTKDRRRRVADISTAVFVLEKGATLAASAAALAGTPRTGTSWRRGPAIAAAALVIAAAVAAITWVAMRPAPPLAPRISRLHVELPASGALSLNGNDRDLAITPDGSRIVYVGNSGTQIFVRALEALEPVAIYRGAPREPFVSPDGQWVGFVDAGNTVKKVAIDGGPATRLATLDGLPRGATWGPDDSLIVATDVRTTGLQRVMPDGAITVLNAPDRAKGEADYIWPEFLPSGRGVLFTITATAAGLDAAQIAILDLQTGTSRPLVKGGSHAHFVSSRSSGGSRADDGDGYIVYAAAGALRAVPFDAARLEIRGKSIPVVPSVVTTTFGAVDAAIARDGTLAYVSGSNPVGGAAARELVWVDRRGVETPIPAPPHAYLTPRLSPDDTRVAVAAVDQERDLWLWDFAHRSLRQLTSNPANDLHPLWTPDGRELIFSSSRDGQTALYMQSANGTGTPRRVSDGVQRPRFPTAMTRNADAVVFTELSQTGGRHLWLLTLHPARRIERLLDSTAEERNGDLSPDGKWLIYESDQSGAFQVYARPFPRVREGLFPITTEGGIQPVWSRTGREIFFLGLDGSLMVLPVASTETTWSAGAPTRIFTRSGLIIGSTRNYDVSRDGQRFVMIKPAGGSGPAPGPISLIVVQHWRDELKRLVGTE